jgi:hypothetical protein
MRALSLLLLVPLSATAGEVPFGHADWKPSPTDPVGFAGQGSNWYPGATPPTSFWEGTPKEVEVTDAKGKVSKQWTCSDQQSRNILWKVPVPGGSDGSPIVVGQRVISLTTPHHVTCYDADTGKELWHDELKLMTLPVLAADRKSVGAAPSAAQAGPQQDLFERCLGWWRTRLGATGQHRDNKTAFDLTPRKAFVEDVIADLERWKGELKTAYPDLAPALDNEILSLRNYLEGKFPTGDQGTRITPYAGRAPRTFPGPNLLVDGAKKLGLPLHMFTNHWQGAMTDTMATPVSDGEIVGVTFGHGQVAAYELATGRRLWAWRDPLWCPAGASHCQSPLMWKDLFIVPAGGNSKTDGYNMSLLGIDKRTGAIRWESTRGPGGCTPAGTHGDHMSPCLARIPDGKGGIRAVIVGNMGGVIDAETGAVVGQFPQCVGATPENPAKNDYWGSGFVAYLDQRIYKSWGGDCTAPPTNVWPVAWSAEGTMTISAGFKTKDKGASHNPFALSSATLVAGMTLVDPATGQTQAALDRSNGAPTLAGKFLIQATGIGKRMASFPVWDLSDPTKPRRLGGVNLLGDEKALPKDIADLYFTALRHPESKQWCLGTYLGINDGFGVQVSGVTCSGSRIYLKSQTHLYAIGEK